MKINTRTINYLMFLMGVIVLAFVVSFLIMPATALGVSPAPGFGILQDEGAGWGILGLAVGAGLAIGLAGIYAPPLAQEALFFILGLWVTLLYPRLYNRFLKKSNGD